MTVEIITETKEGKNVKSVDIKKMNVLQTSKVAKGISEVIKFINKNDKLQNAIKTFSNERQEVLKEAEEYYKANKNKKEVPEYDVGGQTLSRAGGKVWNDILGVLSDLLYEIPETVVSIVSNASGIDKDVLGQQDLETFIDVVEETVQVNDIEKLTGRVKKLGSSLKPMFNLNNKEK